MTPLVVDPQRLPQTPPLGGTLPSNWPPPRRTPGIDTHLTALRAPMLRPLTCS